MAVLAYSGRPAAARRRLSLAAGAMHRRQRRCSASTRLRPSDLNRTVQIRSDPSQLFRYRSTVSVLH